jgi:tRNA A64-2'-O-ribosylphosphate transferase
VIIVDATKRGKTFPDSLSKTIPIWCWVFNNVINKQLQNKEKINLELPKIISKMEKYLIEENLEKWEKKLINSGKIFLIFSSGLNFEELLKKTKKPFQCVWISKETKLNDINEEDIKNLNYYPIYLISASDPKHEIKNMSWEYIQGGMSLLLIKLVMMYLTFIKISMTHGPITCPQPYFGNSMKKF